MEYESATKVCRKSARTIELGRSASSERREGFDTCRRASRDAARSGTRTTFAYLVLAALVFLGGCSGGIHGARPILVADESDALAGAAGYWESSNGKVVALIEDESTGVFLKDYVYKLTFLASDGGEVKVRVKRRDAAYAVQACVDDKTDPKKLSCFFLHATWKEAGQTMTISATTDANLSAEVKDALGKLYIQASDKNNIKLPDDFGGPKGKALLAAIAGMTPRPGAEGVVDIRKITGEQARARIAQNAEAERKEKAEQAAREAERKRVAEAERAAAERLAAEQAKRAKYGLTLCNKSAEDVFFSYGRYQDAAWETHGWYELKVGGCKLLEQGREISGKTFYFHAKGNRGSVWGDDYNLCIHPRSAFDIKGTESCSARGYSQVKFFSVDVKDGVNEFQQDLTGGKPSKMASLAVGDGVYVQGLLSDELGYIAALDAASNRVKVRRAEDGTTVWVDESRVISREESRLNDVGRVVGGAALLYCLFNPEECKKQ